MCSSSKFLRGFADDITISTSIPAITGGDFFNNVCYNHYVRESLLSVEGCIKYTNTFFHLSARSTTKSVLTIFFSHFRRLTIAFLFLEWSPILQYFLVP